MSGKEAEKNFLSRWSRRKIEARRAEEEAKPAGPPGARVPAVPPSNAGDTTGDTTGDTIAPMAPMAPAAPMAPSATSAPLPSIEELRGVESEYRDFLRPGVDEALRRSALKQLFQDPHFNIMDGLDTYIDDYTRADPIPEAMLRTLNQAQGLIFDREDRPAAEQPADAADRPPTVIEEVTEEATKEATEEIPNRSFPEAKDDENSSQPGPDRPSATT